MATEKCLKDADALIAEFEWLQSQVSSTTALEIQEHIQRIKDAPTVDAVPVVRCKDCCWCKEYHCNYMCQHPTDGMPGDVYADDFCSYGERKDNVL